MRTISLTIKKKLVPIKWTTFISWRRCQKKSNYLNVLHTPLFLKASKPTDLDWALLESRYRFCIYQSVCLLALPPNTSMSLGVSRHWYFSLSQLLQLWSSWSFISNQNESNYILFFLYPFTKDKVGIITKELEGKTWVKSRIYFFQFGGKLWISL